MAPTLKPGTTLLLLPALSLPLRSSSLRAAYKPTFDELLPKLSSGSSQIETRLDVAIVLSPPYALSPPASRASTFPEIQKLLEETYTLICIVAAQHKIELDFPGGIDVRIFILEARSDQLPQQVLGKQSCCGPVVDFQTFVSARSYDDTYSTEGERGEECISSYISAFQAKHKSTPSISRLPCGSAIAIASEATNEAGQFERQAIHKSVAVGGTFDHLHIGHKLLLTATVLLAEPSLPEDPAAPRLITIGITGDELLVNKKHAALVESWDERQTKTAEFIESIMIFHSEVASSRKIQNIDEPGPNGKVVRVSYGSELVINYTRISDPFGPTITDQGISALVISQETRAGGQAVNDKRKEKGWQELEVFEIDVLDATPADGDEADGVKVEKQSFESKISSTEIRRRLGEKLKISNGH